MAITTVADFDSAYPPAGYSEQGTVASIGTSTVQRRSGSTSMRVNTTAASAWIANTVAGKTWAFCFWLRIATAVSGTASIFQATCASGNIFLRLTTANVFRVTMNTTNFDGPTLSNNRWYFVQAKINTTANPITCTARVDGGTAMAGTLAVATNNVTAFNIGQVTAVTCDLYFDDYVVTDVDTDYPLGPLGLYLPRKDPQIQHLSN